MLGFVSLAATIQREVEQLNCLWINTFNRTDLTVSFTLMFTIQNEAPRASPWLGGYNLHAMGLHKDYTCHGLIQQEYIMQNTDGAKWECIMSQFQSETVRGKNEYR